MTQPWESLPRCAAQGCDLAAGHGWQHLQRAWDHRDPGRDTWTQRRGTGGRFIAFTEPLQPPSQPATKKE